MLEAILCLHICMLPLCPHCVTLPLDRYSRLLTFGQKEVYGRQAFRKKLCHLTRDESLDNELSAPRSGAHHFVFMQAKPCIATYNAASSAIQYPLVVTSFNARVLMNKWFTQAPRILMEKLYSSWCHLVAPQRDLPHTKARAMGLVSHIHGYRTVLAAFLPFFAVVE